MCHKVQKDIFLSSYSLQITPSGAFYWDFLRYFTKSVHNSSFPTFHKSEIITQVVIIAYGGPQWILVRAGV